MKREHTLRYLLLRHLKRFADRVPHDLLVEVTHSLHVVADREGYVVTWRARGAEHEQRFARDAFVFYRRGDNTPERRTVGDPLVDDNGARARQFGAQVFGVPAPPPDAGAAEARESLSAYGLIEAILLAVALFAVGRLSFNLALVMFVLYAVEYQCRGRLWTAALFLIVPLVGPPTAALLGALTYGMLQLFDPDPTDRVSRMALCGLTVAVALVGLARADHQLSLGISSLMVAACALIATAARSLYSMHFRAMPLTLPSYALGLFLDGYAAASLAAMTCVLLSVLIAAYGYRWIPVQRERVLTPNG